MLLLQGLHRKITALPRSRFQLKTSTVPLLNVSDHCILRAIQATFVASLLQCAALRHWTLPFLRMHACDRIYGLLLIAAYRWGRPTRGSLRFFSIPVGLFRVGSLLDRFWWGPSFDTFRYVGLTRTRNCDVAARCCGGNRGLWRSLCFHVDLFD